MERAARPVSIKFNFRSTDAVVSFLEATSDLALKKEIDSRLLGSLNGAAGIAVRILQPPQPISITQTQAVLFDEKMIRALAEKLKMFEEPKREIIIDAIAELARAEASSGPR